MFSLTKIQRLEEERVTLRNNAELTLKQQQRIKIITADLVWLWEQRRLERGGCQLGAERSVSGFRHDA